jgi:hypothetical protein
MSTTQWRLGDRFKSGYGQLNSWENWDALEPAERQTIEDRYARNRDYQTMHRLKKGAQ